jgi:hypothetical protein
MATAVAAASGRTWRNSRWAAKARATVRAEANTALSLSLPVAGTSMVFIIGSPGLVEIDLDRRLSALIEINGAPFRRV